MSEKRPLKSHSETDLSEEEVAVSWLRKNPDMLKKYPEFLTYLEIEFESENITSLQKKQVQLLREKNLQLLEKMNSWAKLAEANQKVSFCLHALSASLLKESLKALKEEAGIYPNTLTTSQICRTVFNEFFPDLRLALCWLDSFSNNETRTIHLGKTLSIRDERVAGLFRRAFSSGIPSCEPLNNAQKIALFGKPVSRLASTVIVPIICPENKTPAAVLSLGSADPHHFAPKMGTLFLTQLGSLIGVTATASAKPEE